MYRKLTDVTPNELVTVLEGLALTYQMLGQTDTAVNLQKQSVEINGRSLSKDHPQTARSWAILGHLLCQSGDLENGFRYLRSSWAILGEKEPTNPAVQRLEAFMNIPYR